MVIQPGLPADAPQAAMNFRYKITRAAEELFPGKDGPREEAGINEQIRYLTA